MCGTFSGEGYIVARWCWYCEQDSPPAHRVKPEHMTFIWYDCSDRPCNIGVNTFLRWMLSMRLTALKKNVSSEQMLWGFVCSPSRAGYTWVWVARFVLVRQLTQGSVEHFPGQLRGASLGLRTNRDSLLLFAKTWDAASCLIVFSNTSYLWEPSFFNMLFQKAVVYLDWFFLELLSINKTGALYLGDFHWFLVY